MLDVIKRLIRETYGNIMVASLFFVLMLTASYFLARSLYGSYVQLNTANWVSCDGKIINIIMPEYDSDGARVRSGEIEYSYSVGEQIFRSARVDFTIDPNYKRWDILYGKHPGQQVQVFYDPSQPSRAVLNNQMQYDLDVVLFSLMLFVFSIWPNLIFMAKVRNGKGLWSGFQYKDKQSSQKALEENFNGQHDDRSDKHR